MINVDMISAQCNIHNVLLVITEAHDDINQTTNVTVCEFHSYIPMCLQNMCGSFTQL